jgi:molybdenum-dependent DNA-binding transcriptional regulator ModE
MRLFALVVETGSFTAAAKRSGIPKRTLSRRIALLERALGVRLLQRTTRRLRPTEAGARYARRCGEIATLASDANRELCNADDTPRGTLRVTADPVFGEASIRSPPRTRRRRRGFMSSRIRTSRSLRLTARFESRMYPQGCMPCGYGTKDGASNRRACVDARRSDSRDQCLRVARDMERLRAQRGRGGSRGTMKTPTVMQPEQSPSRARLEIGTQPSLRGVER